VGGLVPFVRYLVLLGLDEAGANLQSLLLGVVLVVTSVLSLVIGVVADLTRINRTLAEETLEYQKWQRYGG